MRIISGKLSRFNFKPPKGFNSRPTTSFAKEGLFNIIHHQFSIEELKVLDLFCGTGNITFEFASRDANIIAVDNNYKCTSFIKSTALKCKVDKQIQVFKSDVFKFIEKYEGEKFDLIFADPPYDFMHYEKLISIIESSSFLAPNGVLILEHSKRTSFNSIAAKYDERKYGGVVFSFFKF